MRAGADGDQVLFGVDIHFGAEACDVREALGELAGAEVAHVQVDAGRLGALHLRVDGAADHVAGRELGALVVAGHETFAGTTYQ
jgi:hypothetical protein